jgi:biofilm PGA synthesis N-glycosyltransferase PgaC
MWNEIIIFVILSLYAALISYLQTGLHHLIKADETKQKPPISIIVAARNEEENIPHLLQDIEQQNYPNDLIELIVVDDASTDNTYAVLQNAAKSYSYNLQILQADGGKKAALVQGVKHSSHQHLLFTDADCRLPQDYLSSWASFFENSTYEAASGPVFFSGESFWNKMAALEFSTLVASGAGALGHGKVLMANGANLAVRKEAWLKASAQLQAEATPSGDDIFLLEELQKNQGKNSVGFFHCKEAMVESQAPKSFAAFMQQRIRWTSKSKVQGLGFITGIALLVFFTSLASLFALFNPLMWHYGFPIYFLLFIGIKMVIDYGFLATFLRHYHREKLLKYAFLWAWIYPFYIVVTAVIGNIIGFKWKDRNY